MKKLIASVFIMFALLTMSSGRAFAQDITSTTNTIESIALESDSITGETIVVIKILDESTSTSQTIRISLETAESLGLVTIDPITGASTVAVDAVGKAVEFDPTTFLTEEDSQEEDQHPVGSALSDFFSELLGVEYETIMSYHDDGIGFGVIAQALWLTNNIDGDTATFEALLKAKQSGDYSDIVLADGSIPDNWGDVVSSLKKGDNLGNVRSGKAESNESNSQITTKIPGKGNENNNSNNENKKENGNGKGNGKGGGRGNGGGRP